MTEYLYKHLSIVLLALLLLVLLGSLLTYSLVGQESINIAFAGYDTQGYYRTNYMSIPECNDWNYNITASSDGVEFYSDSLFSFNLIGSGTLVNNLLTCTSDTLTLKIVPLSWGYVPNTANTPAVFGLGYTTNNTNVTFNYRHSNGLYTSQINGTNQFIYHGENFYGLYNRFCYVSVVLDPGETIYLHWLVYNLQTSSFSGYVSKNYSNYGYNQGYTDGVNSASGSGGITSLDNLSWVVPSSLPDVTPSETYSVSGVVNHDNINFNTLVLSGTNMILSPGNYTVQDGDILTFTGGIDLDNSTLIQYLVDYGSFIGYSDGYTDGYDSGYDIGYDTGFSEGHADVTFTLDNVFLQPFAMSSFTGAINQDPTTFWWSIDSFITPSGYGYLYFNISGLPVGSIVTWNFPFKEFIMKDTSNTQTSFDHVSVYYDYGYYNNLSVSPSETLPSIRLQESVTSYSFTLVRPGDTLVLYFPLNYVSSPNERTFALSWYGGEYDYSLFTSSVGIDLQLQLESAYSQGLSDGNSQGYVQGYTVGYNVGADGAGQYTFNSLLGAVFDAPVEMFLGKYDSSTGKRVGGLFNFELLGVNLSGFVIALLSIGVVLFIMRLFLRGL